LPPAGSKTALPRRLLPIAYSRGDLDRLRSLALTLGSRTDGRENLLLKRGAMLHADIAMLALPDAGFTTTSSSSGARRYRLNMDDGRPTGIKTGANHWDLGRRFLEDVRHRATRGSAARGPGMDETVRLWYAGTCAYQIWAGDLDPPHFARAIELFPEDPDLLFLRGALHEVMASARRQSAIQRAAVPEGLKLATGTRGEELAQAERFYKRAVERLPAFHEARIRYARVLGERGRHEEAVRELQNVAGAQGLLLRYYAALFLGGELEALARDDEAVLAYERAAELYPTAQSPRLGLSRLAVDRDRAAAREALLRLAAQEPRGDARDDPWWVYDNAGGRGADIILNALHKSIESGGR
jgi:tetratricopeptide (TPR) repeat protein